MAFQTFPVCVLEFNLEQKCLPGLFRASCDPNQQHRWNFKKADWLSFQAQCSSELTEEAFMSAEDPAGQFTDLIQAAGKAVPKTRFSKKNPKVPWFNDSCKKAIKERKKTQ